MENTQKINSETDQNKTLISQSETFARRSFFKIAGAGVLGIQQQQKVVKFIQKFPGA